MFQLHKLLGMLILVHKNNLMDTLDKLMSLLQLPHSKMCLQDSWLQMILELCNKCLHHIL